MALLKERCDETNPQQTQPMLRWSWNRFMRRDFYNFLTVRTLKPKKVGRVGEAEIQFSCRNPHSSLIHTAAVLRASADHSSILLPVWKQSSSSSRKCGNHFANGSS